MTKAIESMMCEWCGDEIPEDEDSWFDDQEHYFCSEMCLGQFEAGRQF
jgi:hypothetical protein